MKNKKTIISLIYCLVIIAILGIESSFAQGETGCNGANNLQTMNTLLDKVNNGQILTPQEQTTLNNLKSCLKDSKNIDFTGGTGDFGSEGNYRYYQLNGSGTDSHTGSGTYNFTYNYYEVNRTGGTSTGSIYHNLGNGGFFYLSNGNQSGTLDTNATNKANDILNKLYAKIDSETFGQQIFDLGTMMDHLMNIEFQLNTSNCSMQDLQKNKDLLNYIESNIEQKRMNLISTDSYLNNTYNDFMNQK